MKFAGRPIGGISSAPAARRFVAERVQSSRHVPAAHRMFVAVPTPRFRIADETPKELPRHTCIRHETGSPRATRPGSYEDSSAKHQRRSTPQAYMDNGTRCSRFRHPRAALRTVCQRLLAARLVSMTASAPLLPRCVKKAVAAAYCGYTVGGFSRRVKLGLLPGPIPDGRLWDLRTIDSWLDRAKSESPNLKSSSAYDEWVLSSGQGISGRQPGEKARSKRRD